MQSETPPQLRPMQITDVRQKIDPMATAQALIRSGAIGDILLMREQEVGGSGPANRHRMGFAHYPKGTPGGSGFGLVDHGIHLIDAFGVDVAMAFDECTPFPASEAEAEASMELSMRWAKRSKTAFREAPGQIGRAHV